jgi:hypothetical protein
MSTGVMNISYKNYELDYDLQARNKEKYGNYLQRQIKEKEEKKRFEKERKRMEEVVEERKLSMERQYLKQLAEMEDKRRKEEAEKYKLDNERIMNSYMVLSKPKFKKEELILPKILKSLSREDPKMSFNLVILTCI